MKALYLAAARNEKKWLERYSQSQTLYRRSCDQYDLSAHLRILDLAIEAIPYFIPSAFCEPTIWHPDLSLSNILVSKSGPANIQALIDWQGAWTAPFCQQAIFPPCVEYEGGLIDVHPGRWIVPQLPDDLDSRPKKEQDKLRLHLKYAFRQKRYEMFMFKDKRRVGVQRILHLDPLNALPHQMLRSWSDGATIVLKSLLDIRDIWDHITLPDTPCPIKLTDEEHQAYTKSLERYVKYEEACQLANEKIPAGPEVWVPNKYYYLVKLFYDDTKEEWDENATGYPFPYEDGTWCYFLS